MEGLDRDPLFVALTRPQMALGVPYVVLVLNAILTTELFLVAKSRPCLVGQPRPASRPQAHSTPALAI